MAPSQAPSSFPPRRAACSASALGFSVLAPAPDAATGPAAARFRCPALPTAPRGLYRPPRRPRTARIRAAVDADADAPDERPVPTKGEGQTPEAQPAARPQWAPEWLPQAVIAMPPALQLICILPMYVVHLLFISKKSWSLPTTVFANTKASFSGIPLDSIVGLVVVLVTLLWRKARKIKPLSPDLLHSDSPPWKVPRETKPKLLSTALILVAAFVASSYGAVICEQLLLVLSVYGVPLTLPTMHAWKVLLGHLMWVVMAIKILGTRLRPFFSSKGTWIRWKWNSNWLWWSIGGYAVSSLLFNGADFVNQLVLPPSVFLEDTVVSKLINPENRDLVAMAVGSIGPCVTAPVFEEVLYRGFLLPALTAYLPLHVAIPVSSVLFAVNHMSFSGLLPLTVLGLAWAIIYTQSRNLLVTILIHCMWNSRVFLVSLLGL